MASADKLGFPGDGAVEGGDGGQCAEGAVNIFLLCLSFDNLKKVTVVDSLQFTIVNSEKETASVQTKKMIFYQSLLSFWLLLLSLQSLLFHCTMRKL